MEGTKVDLLILIGTAGMLLLAFAIILFVIVYQRRMHRKQQQLNEMEIENQKQLMEAVILTKEKEQKRIAQELHDGIGSALTALKVSLIQMDLQAEDKKWIGDSIKSIGNDVRRISNELMPSILENMGLQMAILKLSENLERSAQIKIECIQEEYTKKIHSDSDELAIYRVVQEVLNNIIKYAHADNIRIEEHITAEQYELKISDNGDGYSPSNEDITKSGSLGLKNIQSRIQQVNGTIEYLRNSPKGTVVQLKIPRNGKVKVAIAEDQEIFRSALFHLLNKFHKVEVIIQAENGKALIDSPQLPEVDITILDYKMPIMGGIETSKELRKLHPNIKIIILSMFDDESFVEKAIENGANAYLSKDDDLEELEFAIQGVLDNQYYFNDRVSKLFIKSMINKGKITPSFVNKEIELTQMEVSIIDLMAQEFTTQEIADKLFRSTRTIEKIRSEMMKKTNTRNSIGLVMYGVKQGIIKP